jgi:radical SAM superfamily enzyme YgiQ (UPF0313 family)
VKKVLLLNPPGKYRYHRQYYCSEISKGRYIYHPVDLVYQSGYLNNYFQIYVIDAIAERLTNDACLSQIDNIKPEVIIFLLSSPSYYEDVDFMNIINRKFPDTILIGSGDVYRELRSKAFEIHHFLDAIFLNFSTDNLLLYLLNDSEKKIDNVIYKCHDFIIEGPEKRQNGPCVIPLPRWDLFKLNLYSFPFARRKKYATILTDYGCPYICTYCPIGMLDYKLRDIDGVIAEMSLLNSLQVEELFVLDQTFGVDKNRTFELLQWMIHNKFNFSWTCLSRVDVLNYDIMKMMKKAGCHTIIWGIESASEEMFVKYKKNIIHKQINDAIDLCKKCDIRTVGTFILGLPDDTESSIKNTIKYAKQLKLDFASFNIATPKFGTMLRKISIEAGLFDKDNMVTDCG